MKNLMLMLLTGCLLNCFLQSCIKNGCDSPKISYQELTTSVKRWLPYPATADLVFEDLASNADTIHLEDLFVGDDDIFRGDECPMARGQFIRCNFIDYNSNDTIQAQTGYRFIFSTSHREQYAQYNEDINSVGIPSSYEKFEPTVTLNTKIYQDCMYTACSPNSNCVATGITAYYFSRGKGLIAYVKNSVLWTLK